MIIAFTICSNNYLAYASVLAASLKKHNPEYRFVLGLVDELCSLVDYSQYPFDEIITVKDLDIPYFEAMSKQYNIIELNTAVKPFYFNHMFQKYPRAGHVLYFDPDIEVYAGLHPIQKAFADASILLIPHFSTQHIDQPGIITHETKVLQRGLYNLGFIGLKNTPTSLTMVKWWKERLTHYCFINPAKGMFTDQKWIDLVPLYFEDVAVLKRSGCDVAYWNLYEYQLDVVGGKVMAGDVPLIFYHFSAFKLNLPGYVRELADRFDSKTGSVIVKLYEDYREQLFTADYSYLTTLPCAYVKKPNIRTLIRRRIRDLLLRRLK